MYARRRSGKERDCNIQSNNKCKHDQDARRNISNNYLFVIWAHFTVFFFVVVVVRLSFRFFLLFLRLLHVIHVFFVGFIACDQSKHMFCISFSPTRIRMQVAKSQCECIKTRLSSSICTVRLHMICALTMATTTTTTMSACYSALLG